MRPVKVIPISIYNHSSGRPGTPITEEEQRSFVLRRPGGKKKRPPVKLPTLPGKWGGEE